MPHEQTVDHSAKMRQRHPLINQDSIGQQGMWLKLAVYSIDLVRGWSKFLTKAPTVCYDEEEEDSRSSNSENDENAGNQTARSDKAEADHSEKLNSHDVLVPIPSQVDKES